jgi:hypothetical protein
MNPRMLLLWSVAVWALGNAPARAHFLFIHIGPLAEAGRVAEVYFSELAGAGDPRFIDKVAHTQLWVQTTPNTFQALKVQKAADRLRALLPPSGSMVVIGSCQYGVLARPNQTPFLLRYYPKAMAGSPAELARMQPSNKVPLEIMASVEGDQLSLVALRDGKPIPEAEFHTVDSQLANTEFKAGPDGRATWKPAAPGRYSIYARYTTKSTGKVDDKSYEEIREFATLALQWPLERKEPDAAAVALFQEAIAARAQWKGFPGFTAKITGAVDGRSFDGKVTVQGNGTVQMESEEKVVQQWVKEQLGSIALHRGAGSQGDSSREQPKPVLHFADDQDNHPLGRLLVFEGGRFASSYRVKDKQIMVVNRHTGRQHMTITVLDNDRNRDGLFLPRSYTVQYWDAVTGTLQRCETIQERWQRVDAWDLPAVHTVTVATEAGLAVRSFTLSEHQLLTKNDSRKDAKTQK